MQSYTFRGRVWPAECCLSAAGLQTGDFVSVHHKLIGGGGDGGSTGAESRSSFLEMYATKKAAKVNAMNILLYEAQNTAHEGVTLPQQYLNCQRVHSVLLYTTACMSQSLVHLLCVEKQEPWQVISSCCLMSTLASDLTSTIACCNSVNCHMQVNPVEAKIAKWTRCNLSGQPLQPPCVADELGNLYNKDAMVQALVSKTLPGSLSYISSLKHLIDLK